MRTQLTGYRMQSKAAPLHPPSSPSQVVGFYSTGPKIRTADLQLDALMRKYCAEPVFVIIDVRPDVDGIPTQAYVSEEEVHEGKETLRTFRHVPSAVGAYDAEETVRCWHTTQLFARSPAASPSSEITQHI